ncbi:MAG: hypothetical protein QOH57_5061 [Mycobacterium sp.]|nr:hypothetical protein [Mycobacterium sp.]
MRFNPPPGWPVSPGWAPHSTFVPDPSWPPAPPGWPFWVDDSAPPHGYPAYPPPWQPGPPFGPPPNHTTRNVLIGLGVALVLVVGLVVGLVVAFGGDSSKAKSDEDQIREVVVSLESAWNDTDYVAFIKHSCRTFADDPSHSEASFKRDRSNDGEATLEVTAVSVHGDNADVTVDRKYADQVKARSVKLDFVKEDGEWKTCPR